MNVKPELRDRVKVAAIRNHMRLGDAVEKALELWVKCESDL